MFTKFTLAVAQMIILFQLRLITISPYDTLRSVHCREKGAGL